MSIRVLNRLAAACVLGAAVSLGSTAPAAAATTASLSPVSGPPGTSVTVTGGGFDPSARVDVFFGLTDLEAASSDATGAVSITIQIPKGAQPGAHWITLDEAHANRSSQAQFSVVASWPQGGYGPSGRNFNPLENTVDSSNADQLAVAWSRPVTPYANTKRFVVFKGNVYVFDENGTLWAFAPTGTVLWHATAGAARTPQAAPAASGGWVFTASGGGVVRAFPYVCRTDGGLCTTPQWTRATGTAVNGLTFRAGLLYAAGADGLIHVINATTGAPGTSLAPNASGPITQPVAFDTDDTAWIVQGHVASVLSSGGGVTNDFGALVVVSAPVVGHGIGYATMSDGFVREIPYGWSTPIGTLNGCAVPPAFAKGDVYAAGCDTVGAYDADTGNALWITSIDRFASGLSVANGVLYVCAGGRVAAYDASYGNRLGGSIAPCDGVPEIVNGTLYVVLARVRAVTLDGATDTVAVPRPDPSRLRPDLRLRLRNH